MEKIKFRAKSSGDYECGCWDVDYDTFVRLTGKNPERFDSSYFNPRMYKLYTYHVDTNFNDDEWLNVEVEEAEDYVTVKVSRVK